MKHRHSSVYARIVRDGSLLCVRKTRGPYPGQLDLPGGGTEAGESWNEALHRELVEELGVGAWRAAGRRRVDFRVRESSTREKIEFQHLALVVDVRLADGVPNAPIRSSDTAGWEWFDLTVGDRSQLSALAKLAIDLPGDVGDIAPPAEALPSVDDQPRSPRR